MSGRNPKSSDGQTASGAARGRENDPRLEAAQRRLRESVGRAETLVAIREIVTNLLGCEEIGLFTLDRGVSGLLWSLGVDPQQHGSLESFKECPLPRVLRGEYHVAQAAEEGQAGRSTPPLRVFIPIRLNQRTVGVLVMLKLLPQKTGFDEADLQLVELLSRETGKALFDGSASAES
jgi:chemotaxis protein CheD